MCVQRSLSKCRHTEMLPLMMQQPRYSSRISCKQDVRDRSECYVCTLLRALGERMLCVHELHGIITAKQIPLWHQMLHPLIYAYKIKHFRVRPKNRTCLLIQLHKLLFVIHIFSCPRPAKTSSVRCTVWCVHDRQTPTKC